MGVLVAVYGKKYQRGFFKFMLDTYEIPPTGIADQLLSANGWFLAYHKGSLLMYALHEFIGNDKVDKVLQQFLPQHQPGKYLLPTYISRSLSGTTGSYSRFPAINASLFLCKEHIWDLKTESAVAKQLGDISWQFDVEAGKPVVDRLGTETMIPMNDWRGWCFFTSKGRR